MSVTGTLKETVQKRQQVGRGSVRRRGQIGGWFERGAAAKPVQLFGRCRFGHDAPLHRRVVASPDPLSSAAGRGATHAGLTGD